MATSGTVSSTTYTAAQLIEHAYRRCGVLASEISGEMLQVGIDSLNFLLSQLLNMGVNLWRIEKDVNGLTIGQYSFNMPVGVNDVLDVNVRTVSAQAGGNPYSSPGGIAASAFSGTLNGTYCTQSGPNGTVWYDFGTLATVVTAGFNPGATGTYNLIFESGDGTTWGTAFATGTTTTYTQGQWSWFDIPTPTPLQEFRVRELSGNTLNVAQLTFGQNFYSIPMGRYNRDQYWALPNPAFTSNKPLVYWADRQRQNVVMHLWPNPSDSLVTQVVTLSEYYPQDVGLPSNQIDVPQRWNDAVIYMLADRVFEEIPINLKAAILKADPQTPMRIAAKAKSVFLEASAEERDNSVMSIAPSIAAYTR